MNFPIIINENKIIIIIICANINYYDNSQSRNFVLKKYISYIIGKQQ